jgi:hypothetical protein
MAKKVIPTTLCVKFVIARAKTYRVLQPDRKSKDLNAGWTCNNGTALTEQLGAGRLSIRLLCLVHVLPLPARRQQRSNNRAYPSEKRSRNRSTFSPAEPRIFSATRRRSKH